LRGGSAATQKFIPPISNPYFYYLDNKPMLTRLSDAEQEQEILKAEQPVFVTFSAKWCGPCKFMQPTIEALAKEFQDQITFISLDIEQYQTLSSKFMAVNLPTFLIFKNGVRCDRLQGIQEQSKLRSILQTLL
jgi:thioredoxin 1